ncbi:unnamed protein product [Ectocarpus sp. 12 AP-2014]
MRMIKIRQINRDRMRVQRQRVFRIWSYASPEDKFVADFFSSVSSGEKACIRRLLTGTENLIQKRVTSDSEKGNIVSIKTLLESAVDLFWHCWRPFDFSTSSTVWFLGDLCTMAETQQQ